jgi:hypothetical protein
MWMQAQQQLAAAAAAAQQHMQQQAPAQSSMAFPFWGQPPVAAVQQPPWSAQLMSSWPASGNGQGVEQPQQSESSEGGLTTSSTGAALPVFWQQGGAAQGQPAQHQGSMDWQAHSGG